MVKKEPTQAQIDARAKFGAAAKERAAAKKAEAKIQQPVENSRGASDPEASLPANEAPVDHGTPSPTDYADLLKQITELKAYLFDTKGTTNQGSSVTKNGIVGTFEKYLTDPAHYPNPCERLAQEPRLARFAFGLNYELTWNISVSQYQTKDGLYMKEPKFTIELNKVIMDENTGEPTNGRFTISTGIFHEDPEAALIIAQENDVPVDEENEKQFLDEMRYLRIRNWLMDVFYTPQSISNKSNRKDMVVAGKLVQYFEVNSTESAAIPFGQLNNKL